MLSKVHNTIYFVVGGFAAISAVVLDSPAKIGLVVSRFITVTPDHSGFLIGSEHYTVHWFVGLFIILLTAAFLAVVNFAVSQLDGAEGAALKKQFSGLEKELSDIKGTNRRLEREYEDFMASMEYVSNNIKKRYVSGVIDKFSAVYNINESGDADVSNTVILSAKEEIIHHWRYTIDATPGGADASFPSDISFAVTSSKSDSAVAYQVINNKKQYKEFLIWLLPSMVPGEAREVTIRYSWPRLFSELIALGRERFVWTYQLTGESAAPAQKADHKFSFKFDKRLGEISVVDQLPALERGQLASTWDPQGHRLIEYSSSCVAGRSACSLSLRKTQ